MRARVALARAERWGVEAELVIASVVFERDGWICHLCRRPVPERLRNAQPVAGNYEPLAPVVDHAVALSQGGPHTLANCRTAHWSCNAKKHTRAEPAADLPENLLPEALVELEDRRPREQPTNERSGRGRPRENFGACRLEGCNKPAKTRQLCVPHYHRLARYGDPLKALCACGCGEVVNLDASWAGLYYVDGHGVQTNTSSPQEKLSKGLAPQPVTDRARDQGINDDCLVWTGPRSETGYGRVYLRLDKKRGQSVQVHRLAYEIAHGPGSAVGKTIDHLCGVPLCCNPNHLEAVTLAENLSRAAAVITECPRGHVYDEANTLLSTSGHRICRQCNRNRYHQRKFGHEFVVDPSTRSTKRQRCLICRQLKEMRR